MSSEEEDYMSASFINPQEDKRQKDSFQNWRKRKLNIKDKKTFDLKKVKKDEKVEKVKSYKQLQEDIRETGLKTQISSDNLGFKLMAKMGYKKGQGLGKNNTGRIEPISVKLKSNRGGLGKEAREKERKERKMKAQLAAMKARQKAGEILQEDFRFRMRNQFKSKTFTRDLYKSQKVCHTLDSNADWDAPLLDYYWPKAAMNPSGEDEEKEEFFDGEIELSDEEKLISLTSYLRENYFYCVWCAVAFNDYNDLISNCPGDTNELHND